LKNSGALERVVAIDGKTVRGSKDTFHDKSPIHIVHAWSVANSLCLGQYRTVDKSNEITAIPELLDILEIRGSIVTIDAMGTQTDIATKIIEKEAGYILAVKTTKRDSWKKLRQPASSIALFRTRRKPKRDTVE
jgi:hypothetical protein